MGKAIKIILVILILLVLVGMLGLAIKFAVQNKKVENKSEEENNNIESHANNLEDLPQDYSIQQAIEDGCFVITYNKLYNIEKLDEFINNTKLEAENRVEDSLRIVQSTVEGDLIITELNYVIKDETYMIGNEEVNKTTYVLKVDSTRDKFASQEDRKIIIDDDIPGDIYTICKREENGMEIVELSLCAEINYISTAEKIYKDKIEVCRYPIENTERK